jgi:hypothetical protein
MGHPVMADSQSPDPSGILRRFAIAGWGACLGTLVATTLTATLIAVRGDTHDHQHAALLPSEYLKEIEVVPWQESYEHLWYALTCGFGVLGGWAAARYGRASSWLALVAGLSFVPICAWACRGVFEGRVPLERLLACMVILAVPLLRRACPVPEAALEQSAMEPGPPTSTKSMWLTAALLCLPLIALLYGFLGPHDVPTVASECNTELHVASYIVGPALYYRAHGVVPGLDFESHYGIGHAYTFSLVMGSRGLQHTLERYVVFLLVVTILFYLSALFVLTDWLRSPWAAFVVTIALVAASCEGLAYNYPSGWPIRYPFLFAFMFAAVRGVNARWWCVAAGGIAGLSLWWQTDIGLYTLAAGICLYAAQALFLGGRVSRTVVFVATSIAAFFAICTLLHGPSVLSLTFAERLLEPLLLYATGFGNELMTWKPGWSYWYNLLGPGIAIASVAVMIASRHREIARARPTLYAATASLLGLAMLFKWVNRSFDVLWGLNGGLVIAVVGWWVWVAWKSLANHLAVEGSPRRTFARRAVAAMAILALVAQAVRIDGRSSSSKHRGGSSSPLVRIQHWTHEFRNPINAARRGIGPYVHPSPVDRTHSRYLQTHTRPAERVAVISGADWNYLVDAGRAPRLYWLQFFLVHSPVLLDRCMEDVRHCDSVFVESNALTALRGINPAAHDAIVPILAEQFELSDHSCPRWQLYRRKPGLTAGR